MRVRGRVSRSGQVTWSPCLRTDKGPKQVSLPPRSSTAGVEAQLELASPEGAVRHGRYTVTLLDYRDERLQTS